MCNFFEENVLQGLNFWVFHIMLSLERQIQFDMKIRYEETVTCSDTGYWKLKWNERGC